MVGYYNTLPFLFGLEKSNAFNLILDIPSKCMDYYISGEADVALVPIGTLLNRTDFKIVTDYCIGCNGAVRTVCLFSNNKVGNITKVYLDKDSRTSQLLVKVLCERIWRIDPLFEEIDVRHIKSHTLDSNEAVLMIGDKVFGAESTFKYRYDLGIEWQRMTDLPFAFAVWIARENVSLEIIEKLNLTLSRGVDNIEEVLIQNKALATKIDLSEYFKKYIDFQYDEAKQKALQLFFEMNQRATAL